MCVRCDILLFSLDFYMNSCFIFILHMYPSYSLFKICQEFVLRIHSASLFLRVYLSCCIFIVINELLKENLASSLSVQIQAQCDKVRLQKKKSLYKQSCTESGIQ
jgi:hypothetical protein